MPNFRDIQFSGDPTLFTDTEEALLSAGIHNLVTTLDAMPHKLRESAILSFVVSAIVNYWPDHAEDNAKIFADDLLQTVQQAAPLHRQRIAED